MTSVKAPARSVWASLRLMVAFHKDRDGRPHMSTRRWFARDGRAGIHRDPDQQEAVLVVSSADRDEPRDIDVCFRQHQMDLVRDDGVGWERIIIEDGMVSVRVNGQSIRILADGSVAHVNAGVVSHIDPSVGVLVATDMVQASVSQDGSVLEQRTPLKISRVDPDGIWSRPRRSAKGGIFGA